MSRRATTLGSLFLFTLAVAQATAGDRPWKTATTPNYRLISQASDDQTNRWMREFDQFILSTTDVLKMNLRSMPPLTVVIFDREKDYDPYKLLKPNGTTAPVAGQFVRQPSWSMIGMAYGSLNDEGRRTIYHEATHWLMSADQERQPRWFSEGIAEMLSTFESRGGKVSWAKPIDYHLAVLNSGHDMPMADFLTARSALFDRDEHTTIFYAQSWAFTHFMLFSKESVRQEQLRKFLELYRTKSGEATVSAVFGADLGQLKKEFNAYEDQKRWRYMTQPLKPAPEPPPLQAAPPALVESSLAFLALGANRMELAQNRAEKALALDSSSPAAHEVLAYIAMEKRDLDAMVREAESARHWGSKDSNLYVLLGDTYETGPNSRQPNASKWRIGLYEQAVNLDPRRLEIYERLTEALLTLDNPREEDRRFLEVGLKVFPGEDWLRVGTAVVSYRIGERDNALTTLDGVLRPESTLDESQRAYAANLRLSWLGDAMTSEINAAMAKNDIPAARSVLARYRERIGESEDFTKFASELETGLRIQELTNKLDSALRGRRTTEVRAIASQLLALPDLPARLRTQLEQQLQKTH